MTPPRIRIDFAETKWKKSFPRSRAKIMKAAAAALQAADKPPAFRRRVIEVGISLSDDKTIKRLNRDWRGKNKPTNVLSFPWHDLKPGRRQDRESLLLPKGPVFVGDVILAYGTIRKEARAQRKTLESHAIHLIVHGILHLFGYDHIKSGESNIMESIECDILCRLGYPDPYHEFPGRK
jgi:probable rRNA maturation factor